MKLSHGRVVDVATNKGQFGIEQLEPRLVLTGYFAAGISYDDMGPVIYSEFGQYDDGTGAIIAGTRSDTESGVIATPWSGFLTYAGPFGEERRVEFDGGDPFSSRVSAGIGNSPLGISVGFGGAGYQLPIGVDYVFDQPTDLDEGSGSRDGDYFFSGAVRNTMTDAWSFVHGPANIDGVALTGHQTFEGDIEVPYSYNLNPAAMFSDGYTLFDGHSSVALFSSALRSVVQTDLDDSDGFQSYSVGMKIDLSASFSISDLAGDVFALSLTGSSNLGSFFGETGGSSGGFTYAGAVEFADGGTYRLYELRDFYENGRASAGVLMSGLYTVDGDEVALHSLDETRRLDMKLAPDLSMSLGYKYASGSNEYYAYGGGPRISDGNSGDYPAVDTSDEEPIRYTFTGITTLIGDGGDNYVVGTTDANEEIRFNVSQISGLDLGDIAYAAWLEDGNEAFEVFGTTGSGVHYIRREADGVWNTGSVTGDSSNIPSTMVDWAMLPGGGMTLGGFNASGELLRFDCADGMWTVDRITGIPAPDGDPGTPAGEVDLLVTPWAGWHLLYLDASLDLRAAWTTPNLSTYYDNNLSQRAGVSSVDGNAVHASYTSAGQISVGFINGGNLNNLWWRPGFMGNWNNTDFADVVGSAASGLSPDFVGTYTDRFTGELFNFGVKADESDAVVIRFGAGTGWEGFTIRSDLGLTSYEIPEVSTLRVAGLVSDDGFDLQGQVPGLGDLPIVSRLFTNRGAGDRDQSLLIYLTPSLVEPTDGE